MKKFGFVYCLLLCSNLTFSQVKESLANYILGSTSAKKSYAILFKNYNGEISFVWSNDLLNYFNDKNIGKANAIKIIKHKLIVADTFNITSNNKTTIGVIDSVKLNLISGDANKGLQSFINKYFKENQLSPTYSDLVKEISFCLWKKQTYLYVGLENGSLPSIGVKSNKIITSNRKVNNTVEGFNVTGLEFYFPKYDYYIGTQSNDTSLLYLKLTSKRTDIQRVSPKLYSGEYGYARFNIDKVTRLITVKLYDDMKNFKTKEIYKYGNEVKQQGETNFYNLTSEKKTIVHRVIIPVIANNE